MLDALLAAEELPEEYRDRCQVFKLFYSWVSLFLPSAQMQYLYCVALFLQDILCNDCERKGRSQFHWLYHKCGSCGSYNTRVIKTDTADCSMPN
jgi:zinc finger-like protein